MDLRSWQPCFDQSLHSFPGDPRFLASPLERVMPVPAYLKSKRMQRRLVRRYSKVSVVSSDHRLAVEIVTYTTKNGTVKKKAGRIRLQVLRAASEDEIGKFIRANVAPGSTIKSDGWKGYSATALAGYQHQRGIQGSPQRGHELAPQIHQAFSNLKAWLIGIHHGVEPKYLQSYLNEFVFRFNRRVYPMSAFRSLLEILTSKQPLTLQKLTKP